MEQRTWPVQRDGAHFSALPLVNISGSKDDDDDDDPNRRQQRRRSRHHHHHQQQQPPPQVLRTRNSHCAKLPTIHSASSHRIRFSSRWFSSFSSTQSMAEGHDFSQLPFDVLTKIAASFTLPNLRSASLVCRSWRDALRPLRESMLFLRWGKRFKHGHAGVRPNLQKALDSFLKGAARGSTLAMVDAGLLYWEMGHKDKGIALYQRAAALGDPAAQCNLGISYLQAEPADPKEAVKWLYEASVAGHIRAQYQLALCLHQGRGVECNLLEAAKWYLRAAEGGYVRAMYNTSLCYSFGEGLARNHRQARKWMKRAADRGHSKAQLEHGLGLFSEGEMLKALVYLELAIRAGETSAEHVKNVVLQQLSASSRDRAMSLADNWRALPSR
ncbi:F-box protein At1g70590 [Macadamia integrifolia]|uniref:F-box protein At1g70590 n=1 Tax=Macadamia integrifolia TaxID=60698 RepID=UPI001C4E60B6|nr:F-box protein At1g70590 [Macadamia integrifolia]